MKKYIIPIAGTLAFIGFVTYATIKTADPIGSSVSQDTVAQAPQTPTSFNTESITSGLTASVGDTLPVVPTTKVSSSTPTIPPAPIVLPIIPPAPLAPVVETVSPPESEQFGDDDNNDNDDGEHESEDEDEGEDDD